MFDLTYFAPKQYWRFLRAFAGMQVHIEGLPEDNGFRVNCDTSAARRLAAENGLTDEALSISEYMRNHPVAVVPFHAVGTLLKDGAKIFRPTTEQCFALEQVEVPLRFCDYQQPFPAVVVQFPEDYVRTKPDYFPKAVLAYKSDSILATVSHSLLAPGTFCFLTMYASTGLTIEQVMSGLATPKGEIIPLDEEMKDFRFAERLAFNSCLMLTQYDTRLRQLDPVAFAALNKRTHDPDPERRRRARVSMMGQAQQIEFVDQTIRFHDVQGTPDEPTDGTGHGTPKRPHWRKGHWRRVAVGQGRKDRKLVFIRPLLVHRELVREGVGEQTVVYQG